MTAAGLRLARRANAVSELHGRTARAMWADVPDAAPIVAITNGVHVPTWQDPRVASALGSDTALEDLRRELKATCWPPSSGAPACGSPSTCRSWPWRGARRPTSALIWCSATSSGSGAS